MAPVPWLLLVLGALFASVLATASGSPNPSPPKPTAGLSASSSSTATSTDDNDNVITQNTTPESFFDKKEGKEEEEEKEEAPATSHLRVDQSPVTLLRENWLPGPFQLQESRVQSSPYLQKTIFNLAALKPLLGIPVGPVPRPAPVDPISTPGATNSPRPGCSFSYSPCRYDDSYPRDKVNLIVDRFYNDVNLMYNDLYHVSPRDLVFYDNRTQSYRSGGHFVCESRIEYMRPGLARNVQGNLLAILNTDKFPQVVRVERCLYEGRRCEYLPPCYKSTCIQRTSYVKLLSLEPDHPTRKPEINVFELPTACSCFVEDFTYY